MVSVNKDSEVIERGLEWMDYEATVRKFVPFLANFMSICLSMWHLLVLKLLSDKSFVFEYVY